MHHKAYYPQKNAKKIPYKTTQKNLFRRFFFYEKKNK